MTAEIIKDTILIGLVVLFAWLQWRDVQTTNQFIATGTASEANPVMAWWQHTAGKYWGAVKAPYVALAAALAWFARIHNSQFVAAAILMILCTLYWVNDSRNADIANGN